MKYLFFCTTALLLVGCVQHGSQAGPAYDSSDLRTYEDPYRAVVCYRVLGHEGLSCLKGLTKK